MSQFLKYRTRNCLRLIVVHAPQSDIKRMSSDIDQRTAALFGFVREYSPCRNSPSSDSVCFCEVDFSQFPFLTCTFQRLSVCTESVLVSDSEFLSGFLPCIHHLPGIFCCCSHRLLTHNMFSRFKCSHRDRAVSNVRSADMYHIDLRIFQELLIILINFCSLCSVFLCSFLCSFSDDIAECNDIALISL